MPVEAKHFKRLAEEQSMDASTEIRRRNVISRAYYASYHRCLRWERLLPNRSGVQVRGGVHSQLVGRLQHPDPACDPKIAEVSRDLGDLLDEELSRRRAADYELRDAISPETMALQLEDTRAVFQKCAQPER